jgi:N-acetyl-anhydromuramyl-L-alanine amidase AmpD
VTPAAIPSGGAQERLDAGSQHTPDRFKDQFYAHAWEITLDEVTAPTEQLFEQTTYWDQFDAEAAELSTEDRRSRQEANTVHNLRKYGLSVAQLKQALKDLGFYDGTVDDKYVDGIAKALERFQTAFKLRHIDGFFGPLTYAKMAEIAHRRS